MFKPTHIIKKSPHFMTIFKDGEEVAFRQEGGWNGKVMFVHPATGFPCRRDMYVDKHGNIQSIPLYGVVEIKKEGV